MHKDLQLTPNQIQVLLQMRILPYSVRIKEQPRLLLLSGQGFLMDIDLPSADHQKQEHPPQKKKRAAKS